jgi:hypothetical protein
MTEGTQQTFGIGIPQGGPLTVVNWHTHFWEPHSIGRVTLVFLRASPSHMVQQNLTPQIIVLMTISLL